MRPALAFMRHLLFLSGIVAIFSFLKPEITGLDHVVWTQTQLREYGRKGVIEVKDPVFVLKDKTNLYLPDEFVARSEQPSRRSRRRARGGAPLDFHGSMRDWARSGCDGAGFYRTSDGRFEYFLPVYLVGETSRAKKPKRMPLPQGLISLASVFPQGDKLVARGGEPVYRLPDDGREALSSRSCAGDHIPSLAPVDPKGMGVALTSPFGYRHDDRKRHKGIDIRAPKGTPVRATGRGRVAAVGFMANGYGQYVMIDHGQNIRTLYAHINENPIAVNEGDLVFPGQLIAYVGNSGRVRGANGGYHLHYEIQKNGQALDPEKTYFTIARHLDYERQIAVNQRRRIQQARAIRKQALREPASQSNL